MKRGRSAALVCAVTLATWAGGAHAFGTFILIKGANFEHRKITRLALQCGGAAPEVCWQPRTLRELSGRGLGAGAVGAPDRGRLFFVSEPHCDNGDPIGPAETGARRDPAAVLMGCRNWMEENLDAAVESAAGLLDADGRVVRGQTSLHCVFVGGRPGRAKCNVLEKFGLLLHASQDFYSHSNWTDRGDFPAPGASGHPGLGNDGPAPFIALRRDVAVPNGLITGCYDLLHPRRCRGRIHHDALNKDTGRIIMPTGPYRLEEVGRFMGPGKTPRGAGGNFERAATAAVLDTADKWRLLRQRLRTEYGEERGARMACVIRSDDPMRC